ncbi:MAG: DUF2064 domain-containing protein [Deferribacteraceae bacterium]|jgi:glycosyltransferase A (GT-A) superfamily protein (DUF2064 family)|nr:DUF2064 domain-containing protein [Deferribacteraceae bacterium]
MDYHKKERRSGVAVFVKPLAVSHSASNIAKIFAEAGENFVRGLQIAYIQDMVYSLGKSTPINLYVPKAADGVDNGEKYAHLRMQEVVTSDGANTAIDIKLAFSHSFKTNSIVALVCADFPVLTSDMFMTVREELSRNDSVVCPTSTGDIAVIAFNRISFVDCFEGVEWGEKSASQVLSLLKYKRVYKLRPIVEPNSSEDLIKLAQSRDCPMMTREYLKSWSF